MTPGRLLQAQQRRDRGLPDHAVMRGIGLGVGECVALLALPIFLLDRIHQRLIVRMHHQRQVGLFAGLHDLQQLAVVVHADARHVRIAAAGVDHHENLEAGDALLRQKGNFLGDGRRRIEIPVDDGVAFVDRKLLLQQRDTVGRRCDVWHRNAGRHAAGGALLGRSVDRVFVFKSRLAALTMMRMHVDDCPAARRGPMRRSFR